jgi:hypothetical protein
VQIHKPKNLLDILDAEIEYLENCVENPFGEFFFVPLSRQTFQHIINILAFLLSAGLINSYRISSLNASRNLSHRMKANDGQFSSRFSVFYDTI